MVVETSPREPVTGLEPVAIELWVLAGTSAEEAREHGCAHLLEHMLFKPTRIRGNENAVFVVGGHGNIISRPLPP